MNHLFFNPHRMNAILQRGFDQTNLVGSVGGVTYRRVAGVTVASQKVPMHVEHTRTAALMLTRMKWVNLVALWKSINTTGWHPSFQRENRRISDFNMFLRANFAAANTFITKEVSRAYGSVVAPVRLTSGSFLSPVTVEDDGQGRFESNLSFNGSIGNSTTLKGFSDLICEGNDGWQDGDKLVILVVRQMTTNGVPYSMSVAQSVTLRTDDDANQILLNEYIDPSWLAVVDGTLALSFPVNGGCAFVHSRIVDGETVCSTQSLVVNNSSLADYQGLTAFNKAAVSYGGVERNQLLTPDSGSDFIFQP